jgi:transposase
MKKAERIEKRSSIKAYLKEGHSESKVAALVPCSLKMVKTWKKRFEVGDSAEDKPRQGRPRFPEAVRATVVTQSALKRNRSTRATAKWLETEKDIKMSYRTVGNILHDADLKAYKRQKKPKLTEPMKTKRVKFARKFSKHDWIHTLMTDETEFHMDEKHNPQNDRVWAHSPEDVPPVEKMAHPPGLRLWGGVSALGKTKLHFYNGTLDGPKYKKILEKSLPEMQHIFGQNRWWFQYDGATPHTASETTKWLQSNVPAYITSGAKGDWPARSPDLNWIENIWGIMSTKVYERKARSLGQLKARLQSAWRDLSLDLLQRTAEGMEERLRKVIKQKGEIIDV